MKIGRRHPPPGVRQGHAQLVAPGVHPEGFTFGKLERHWSEHRRAVTVASQRHSHRGIVEFPVPGTEYPGKGGGRKLLPQLLQEVPAAPLNAIPAEVESDPGFAPEQPRDLG